MKKVTTTIAATLALFTFNAHALPMEQGDDLAKGKSHAMTDSSGIVSYYKRGKTGQVSFVCSVSAPQPVIVSLTGGKNLAINMPAKLKNGYNGPFTWMFYNIGSDLGNIKLKLVNGNYAVVRCLELQ